MTSSPETHRMIGGPDGVTKIPQAAVVAESSNPGLVYQFHNQLFKKRGEVLVRCSPEETQRVRTNIFMIEAQKRLARRNIGAVLFRAEPEVDKITDLIKEATERAI